VLEIKIPPPPSTPNLQVLKDALHESFSRFGGSPIYQSKSRTLIARRSQYYDRKDVNYWYGTTTKDLERVKKYRITHFAFICSEKGVVLVPTKTMLAEIQKGNLNASYDKDGQLRHYHIFFFEKNGSIHWKLKTKSVNMDRSYHSINQR